ncbi:MAG: hypothetical protein ACKVS6_08720 [Planctomycetota bacterium]
MRIKSLILLALCFSGACASRERSQEDAQETALIVLKQIAESKTELARKIAAEEKYYRNSIHSIENARIEDEEIRSEERALDRISAQASALRANAHNATAATLAANTSAVIAEENAILQERLQQIREAREKMFLSIEQLNVLNDHYSALERTLVKLSIPPAEKDHLQHTLKFMIDVGKHYQKLNKENKD